MTSAQLGVRLVQSIPICAATLCAIGLVATAGVSAQRQAAAPLEDPQAYDVQADWTDQVPAHLSVVDGVVRLEREGRLEDADASLVLLAGDRLSTERGRAEVLFADGSALALDEFTSIDLQDDTLLRLHAGRILLTIARAADGIDYRVDTAAGSALISAGGEYRISLLDRGSEPEVDVAVLRGFAELVNDRGRTRVRAGSHAVATAFRAPSLPYTFNAAVFDAFDRWADEERRARVGYASNRYLPTEVSYYAGTFDRYGDWRHEPSYGYVWYPQVTVGWRPYTQGRWSFVGRFGWTWVGGDRWSWPTHHYGRWGLSGAQWFWIPERRWAPAWVSWASAPGYVGWCPLGYDNRPVISITHISVRTGDRWDGWNVVPSRSFTGSFAVSRHAVPGRSLGSSVATRFAANVAPAPPVSYPRGPALRSPGARGAGVGRGGSDARASSAPRGANVGRSQLGAIGARGADDVRGQAGSPDRASRSVPDTRAGAPSARPEPQGTASADLSRRPLPSGRQVDQAPPSRRVAEPRGTYAPSVPSRGAEVSPPRSAEPDRRSPTTSAPRAVPRQGDDRVGSSRTPERTRPGSEATRPAEPSGSNRPSGRPSRPADPPSRTVAPPPRPSAPPETRRGGQAAPPPSGPPRVEPRRGPSESRPPAAPPRTTGGEGREAPPAGSGRGQAVRRPGRGGGG